MLGFMHWPMFFTDATQPFMAQSLKRLCPVVEYVGSNLAVLPFFFEMFMQIKYLVS